MPIKGHFGANNASSGPLRVKLGLHVWSTGGFVIIENAYRGVFRGIAIFGIDGQIKIKVQSKAK
jgi:hypothetical protein